MLIPYHVDVSIRRVPIANRLLVAAITVVTVMQWAEGNGIGVARDNPMLLDGWSLTGMVGSLFLHAGPVHLIGNMLFLWVFGNAVCGKVGNLLYLPLFFGFGLLASAAHLLMSEGSAIGASGAINGIVGMFLIFYPLNGVRVIFLLIVIPYQFEISAMWLILFWLVFDIWGAVDGGGSVAYWSHLGGFAAGVGMAAVMLQTGLVQMHRTDRSLLSVFAGQE